MNPEWDQTNGLRYDSKNRHVLLAGKINTLKTSYISNPLRYLYPLFLKLRSTGINDFEQVLLPSLKILDIRGSMIKSNPPDLRKLLFLNELLVRPDQYTEINGKIPRSLKLIQRK